MTNSGGLLSAGRSSHVQRLLEANDLSLRHLQSLLSAVYSSKVLLALVLPCG